MRTFLQLVAALAAAASTLALAQSVQEHEVKAAFLFKFPSFVEWPAAAGARPGTPFTIGVIGAEDVAGELRSAVQGRTVNGRPVSVRRLQDNEPLDGLSMVFLGRGEAARLPPIVKLAQVQPLLIVSDWQGALDQGSMINFVTSGERVRFEVAPSAAERSGLRISSRMLAVAQTVRPGKP